MTTTGKCKFAYVVNIVFLLDSTALESLPHGQATNKASWKHLPSSVDGRALSHPQSPQRSRLSMHFFSTVGSPGMSSALSADQLYMKTIFRFPQFMVRVNIILVFFLHNTMSLKGMYWEMKLLVSCADCQDFI